VQYHAAGQTGIVQASRHRPNARCPHNQGGIGRFNSSACLGSGARTTRIFFMRKILPTTLFSNSEGSRLTMLRTWVLDNEVSEIEMNERQFWNFASLQPVAEKPWATFMGRVICVPDMPIDAQKHLGIFDKRSPGAI
jgi:hypothetical protein